MYDFDCSLSDLFLLVAAHIYICVDGQTEDTWVPAIFNFIVRQRGRWSIIHMLRKYTELLQLGNVGIKESLISNGVLRFTLVIFCLFLN